MKMRFHLLLAGTFTLAGSVSAQMAPPQQDQQAPQPQAEEQQGKDPAELQQKLEGLHKEIEELSDRLNEIHQKALLKQEVRELLVDYERDLAEKIRESSPGLDEQVKAHEKLLDEIADFDADADEASSEEKQKLENLLVQ